MGNLHACDGTSLFLRTDGVRRFQRVLARTAGTFETAYGTHHFRHYEATHLSFLDFARLIRSAYPRAYHFSFQPEAYAKEIAYSPYISELNGDNRDLYRRNIIALEAEIGKQLELFQWTMNNGQLNHKS